MRTAVKQEAKAVRPEAPLFMAGSSHDDKLFQVYVALFLLNFLADQGNVFNGNEPAPDIFMQQHILGLLDHTLATADVM